MKWFPLTRWKHVCQVKLLSKVGYNQLDGQDAGEIKMFAAFNNPVQYLLCHKTKPGNFAASLILDGKLQRAQFLQNGRF